MKGQFGIEAFFSYFLIAISVVAAVIIINAPFVGLNSGFKDKAIEKLEGRELSASNAAGLQLNAYLRTPLPDNLPDLIEQIRDKNLDLGISPVKAADFLKSNEQLYKGKNYADFISGLHQFDKGERQNAFAAVTRAFFSEEEAKGAYDYPRMSVVYGKTQAPYDQGDMVSGQSFPSLFVEQQIPLQDGNSAFVRLHMEKKEK